MRYALTNTGYLSDSPDRFNDFNIIPSNRITMKGVNFPVLGIDNKGNSKIMLPGKDYKFKGSQVTEIPLRQRMQFAGQVRQDATRTTNQDNRFWGIKRGIDSQSMRENEFNSKYPKGRTLHQLRMDTDPAYKARLEWESKQRQEQGREYFVNMPSTDIRSTNYQGNPNLKFLPGNSRGEARASLEDMFMSTTNATAPLLPLKSLKLPNVAKQIGNYLTTKTPLKNVYKSSFKSEIDWSKWNKEIPENIELMKEYDAIEQTSKANNTWMKNSDGSKFKGTPEEFVQQNSTNFKKAFPNILKDEVGNIQKTYHGSQDKFEKFDPDIMRVGRTKGQGIYTSPIKERAASYANKGEKQIYEFYQNANKKQTIIEDFNNLSQKRFDKFLKENPKGSKNFDKKLKSFMDEEDIIFDRDLTDDAFNLNKGYDFYKISPDEYIVPFTNYPKSAIGNNGMFDMNNPNIYKGFIPAGVAGAALQQKKQGGEMKIKNKKGTKLDHGVIYQQGGENDKSENFGRTLLNAGSRALGAIGDTFSIPQRYIMQGLTGEYQDPSEAWGFENVENPQSFPTPFGYIADTNDLRNIANFGMDAVLDPMNVLGAGIAKSFLKGAKSGSVAMRGSRAASNNYPSLEKINQFYKNSYKSPVRTKKAEEVADNNLLQMRLRDVNEYDIDRLNYEDFEIQDGLKDVYKSIRETPEDLLSSDLAMFKNKSYDEFAEGFAGVKKYTPKQVLMKTKWNKEATDINPLYGSEVGDAISRSLYEKMKTSGISPYKKFYNNSEGLGKEINNAQTDYFDKVVNRRRLENRHTNILDETPSAIHPTTIKYNKYGGEYQQGGEWSPGMMFQPNTEFKTDFTPDPLDMMPMSDFEFNSNQRKIDLNRTPQINNMLRDSSQMVNPITRPLEKGIDVPERPSLSKISPSPKMPGIKDDRPRGSYDSGWGLRRAAIGTLALNVASNFTDNTDTQYENMMRKYGNSFEQYNPTAADRGDYTLNAGLGSNFRPDYQEGGEYDVSEAELEYLKSQGYDIELL